MYKKIIGIGVAALCTIGLASAAAASMGAWWDIKTTDWFNDAARFASNHGYIKGVQYTTDGPRGSVGRVAFQPTKPVTRGEIAVMLQKFAYNVHFQETPRVFTDPWYGFKLTFPESWRTSLYEKNWSAPAVEEYDVAMPRESYTFGQMNYNGQFETLFTLDVWTKHGWETPGKGDTAPKDNEVAAGNVVGQNASYVVVLTPVEGTVSGELDQPAADVEKIRQSFAWAN